MPAARRRSRRGSGALAVRPVVIPRLSAMDHPGSVRDAYSSMSQQYIGLFDDPAGRQAHEGDAALVRRHLTGLSGPVLDLGCGPGHWSAYLHSLGVDVTGIDMVPEFIAHAHAAHPGSNA